MSLINSTMGQFSSLVSGLVLQKTWWKYDRGESILTRETKKGNCSHWGKLGEGWTGPLALSLGLSCKSKIISNFIDKKNIK